MKELNLFRFYFAFLLLLQTAKSMATELQYFDKKIDFWGDSISKKEPTTLLLLEQPKNKSEFPWKTYLDPKNKEFFKEGDYKPPEPFMEIARNPSDDNIKQWFDFMKKKNELAARLQIKMQEYLLKTGGVVASPSSEPRIKAAPKNENQSSTVDSARFRIRMYFDSNCPHCKRMFTVLDRFRSEGFQVEVFQVDGGNVPVEASSFTVVKSNLTELKFRGGNAIPFLVIADLKKKALLQGIHGYHDFDEILGLLKAASKT